MSETLVPQPIHSLEGGTEPLRAWFEREVSHVRIIGLMSATCPMCVRGRREGLDPLLATPAEFRMAWAFIDMMTADGVAAVTDAVAGVNDARLTVFHDPARRLGHDVARCLGWTNHVAWDTYFIYEPGALWTGQQVPLPAFWYHQLKYREVWKQTAAAEVGSADWTLCLADKSEADSAHFATGADLRMRIAEAVASARAPRGSRPV